MLRKVRAEQRERRAAFGLGRDDDAVIFTRNDARPWEPGVLSLEFSRFVKRARLRHVRLHDLRHTYATLSLASGTDLKTVSLALGHSAIGMTADTYLHAVPQLQEDSAQRLDLMLRPAIGDPPAALKARNPRRWREQC